ncbi:uncharacterized protein LOC107026776 isoform X2 [Solanum pennellii]|uniref:Uncharacterized protein LOC107026776 isoform X2 n=1 Tax=Solanum pennellii TaxID=28526 RepID=A0ABM1HC15_SOLPN|nr:uncharacterized protein LOC107026776 isoform X2 [Solanum pennellii]
MDLVENPEEVEEKRKEISGSARLRRVLGILVFFCAFFTISFSVLYLAVFLGNLSISSPISLPSQCKIVSSSVDLRSSKVCELGLLNYKAKHVLYPSERKKFRCHYDYYWASVFKLVWRVIIHTDDPGSIPPQCPSSHRACLLWFTSLVWSANYYTVGVGLPSEHTTEYSPEGQRLWQRLLRCGLYWGSKNILITYCTHFYTFFIYAVILINLDDNYSDAFWIFPSLCYPLSSFGVPSASRSRCI